MSATYFPYYPQPQYAVPPFYGSQLQGAQEIHQSSTKDPFSRFSSQNWFLGQDQTRIARLLFRCISWSKIIGFRLTFLRCCSISSCRNRDASTCFSRIKKKKTFTINNSHRFLVLKYRPCF